MKGLYIFTGIEKIQLWYIKTDRFLVLKVHFNIVIIIKTDKTITYYFDFSKYS